jgi:ribosomal protein S18 acetylase RimI-like enzyme
VRGLFREYAKSLSIDLGFQDFEAELAALPGKYKPPKKRLLLAWSGTEAVGCVALRPLEGDACEMKRLYVRPQARGEQLGRRLAERSCQEAHSADYSRICLDMLPTMAATIKLYTVRVILLCRLTELLTIFTQKVTKLDTEDGNILPTRPVAVYSGKGASP